MTPYLTEYKRKQDERTNEAKQIGKRILSVRTVKGLSQRQLADGLDRVSYAFISRIESGQRMPSLRALILIARRLNTTALYLYTGKHNIKCPFCERRVNG